MIKKQSFNGMASSSSETAVYLKKLSEEIECMRNEIRVLKNEIQKLREGAG